MPNFTRHWLLFGACAVLAACHHGKSSPGGGSQPPVGGLDARPDNATCLAPVKGSSAGAAIAVQRAFPNLTFNQPLAMLQAPGDDSRWFVLEKAAGSVRVFDNLPNVATTSDFLTVPVNAASEGGLLGMAFHPQYANNHEVFLSFTEPSAAASGMTSVVARFTSVNGGLTLDPGSRLDVIRVDQPYQNHDGGNIAFGPDGDLYVGYGDGGSGGDPQGHAQHTQDLLGAMLRLDVDGATPYAIPADNPFAANPVCPADHSSSTSCPEIYAWGLRNPWRWSFDTATGTLWVGDVGQNLWEEIDRVRRGGNYGWNCREGLHAYASPAPACNGGGPYVDPVHEYGHTDGNISVTGGFVYRGTALPALAGQYLFADYGSGRIWRLVDDGQGGFSAEELLDTSLAIASFGQGNDGELYVVDIAGGTLWKIVDGGAAPPPGPPVATSLSATGCVNPQSPSQPAQGLIPYEPAAAFWSDGAAKQRWLAIPNGTTIDVGADGDFVFPPGSVLMKHFRLNGALVETRLFMRHPDGEWAGYTYEWNAGGTDATLVQGGKTVMVGSEQWIFPSGNDCLRCHTAAAGYSLGPELAQLNRDLTYPSTGRTANELQTLDRIGLFTTPLGDPAALPSLADPGDATAALGDRARSYLHTNCAQCHRANGPTPVAIDLRFGVALGNTNACDAPPQAGDLGIGASARIIAPGDPDSSVLLARMSRRDANGMPPLASTSVDTAGADLIRAWIASLGSCQ
jgi:uncharacterized repeat protein (TIGR03806 family)